MVNGSGKHPGYPYLHNRYHPVSDPFYPNGKSPVTNGAAYPPANPSVYNYNYNNYTNNKIENVIKQGHPFSNGSTENKSDWHRQSKAVFAPKVPSVKRTDYPDYPEPHFTYAEESKNTQPPPPLPQQPQAQPMAVANVVRKEEEPRYVASLEPATPTATTIPEPVKAADPVQNTAAPYDDQPQWVTMNPPSRSSSYTSSTPSSSSTAPLLKPNDVKPQREILRAPSQISTYSQSSSVQPAGGFDRNQRYSVTIGGLKSASIKSVSSGQGTPGVSITSADQSTMSPPTVQITSDNTNNYDTMQGKLSNAPRQNGAASMPGYTFNNISS